MFYVRVCIDGDTYGYMTGAAFPPQVRCRVTINSKCRPKYQHLEKNNFISTVLKFYFKLETYVHNTIIYILSKSALLHKSILHCVSIKRDPDIIDGNFKED